MCSAAAPLHIPSSESRRNCLSTGRGDRSREIPESNRTEGLSTCTDLPPRSSLTRGFHRYRGNRAQPCAHRTTSSARMPHRRQARTQTVNNQFSVAPRQYLLKPYNVADARIDHRATRQLSVHAFAACFLGEVYESLLQFVQIPLIELLEIEQLVARVANRADHFIELYLKRLGIAVLRALNQEHHQERDDRCARVDDKLPRVAEAEIWA